MKKWILSLFAVTLISGCSTTPSNLKPHSDKYTFQVIGVEIPVSEASAPLLKFENIISHPEATIIEYPTVIAGIGETCTNDQTKSVAFPEDFTVVDGKVVPKEKIIKLGYMVSIGFREIKNEVITYHLKAHFTELSGYDKYDIKKSISVKMPYFNSHSIDTEISQKINTWTSMGGIVEESSNGSKINQMIAVRIIPPKTGK